MDSPQIDDATDERNEPTVRESIQLVAHAGTLAHGFQPELASPLDEATKVSDPDTRHRFDFLEPASKRPSAEWSHLDLGATRIPLCGEHADPQGSRPPLRIPLNVDQHTPHRRDRCSDHDRIERSNRRRVHELVFLLAPTVRVLADGVRSAFAER